ncbi:MAG: MFS transporter [Microcystaceae cyanobacterium]
MTPDQSPYIAPKLDFKTKLTYGIGELSGSLPSNIMVFFFLFFLTDVAGVNPSLAGLIVLIGKVWDAINDPMVGWLSDRTKSPLGRRYPWMLWGAIPLGVFTALLWLILPTDNQQILFAYYSIVAFLFYLSFTVVLLPYNTLSAELTQEYDDRTSLISFRSSFSIIGSIISLILAQIIFATIDNQNNQYLILGTICGLTAILMVFACYLGTKRRYFENYQRYPQNKSSSGLSLVQQFKIALQNRPFLCVIGIYLCSWLSVQMIAAILPYFVVNCMKLPEKHFTQMAIAVQGTALLMMFVWSALSQRWGKKTVYFVGIPLTIIAAAGLFFLQPGQVIQMYSLGVMAGMGISTAYLVPWSMLPDVVDLDELKTGERREGIFYGLVVQLQKMGIAFSVFLVGKFLDLSGYIPSTSGNIIQVQPDSALLAIRLVIAPIPTIVLTLGLISAYFYPITRSVHQDIMSQLKQRSH